jgi:hypothetical protein
VALQNLCRLSQDKTNAAGKVSTNPPNSKQVDFVTERVTRGKEAVLPENLKARRRVVVMAIVIAAIGAALPMGKSLAAPADGQRVGEFAEQVVQVQTKDDIVDSGALFAPPRDVAKPVAIIWIHGWGVNFYSPIYVAISKALARRGYTTITGNTRMHDLGNVEAWRGEKRIRGGGYWGVASEEVRDLAAWLDFAEALDSKRLYWSVTAPAQPQFKPIYKAISGANPTCHSLDV